jgi:hypothetical protein
VSLVEFVEARLAEEQADAEAAGANGWVAGEDGEGWAIELDLGQGPDSTWGACVTCNDSGGNELTEETARHMARQDPAGTLARVTALRAVMKLHRPVGEWPVCAGCFNPDDEADDQPHPCPTLRAVAGIWADHPDYDPAWAV